MRSFICAVLVFAIASVAFSQTGPEATASPRANSSSSVAVAPGTEALPTGFRGISLGMPLDRVKETLKADSMFGFRGDPDVSLVPSTNESLIECTGSSYVQRAFFQFYKGKLYAISLVLNQAMLDHYSMYVQLVSHYGEPTSLNPKESVWESDSVRLSLERPLTVKYIDMKAFKEISANSQLKASNEELDRQEFLGQF